MKSFFCLAIILASVSAQAIVPKPVNTIVNCCPGANNTMNPTLGTCASTRRLQAPVQAYCPDNLNRQPRRLAKASTKKADTKKADTKTTAAKKAATKNAKANRRLQGRLQAVVVKDFVAESCTNFNANSTRVSLRRNQAVEKKCPVTVNGWKCYANNTNKSCSNNTQ